MNSKEDHKGATSERRRSERVSQDGGIRLRIDALQMEGRSENISDMGVLFYTEGGLPVTIEFEDEDGKVRERKGCVVRVQRLRGKSAGWAVEFDE